MATGRGRGDEGGRVLVQTPPHRGQPHTGLRLGRAQQLHEPVGGDLDEPVLRGTRPRLAQDLSLPTHLRPQCPFQDGDDDVGTRQ